MSSPSTLLPEARIDFFVTDASSIDVAKKLSYDWRFARVKVNVYTGDITTAVRQYASEKSPDLMMIETNQIDQSFTGQLEALANVCATETAAIFIGPENDIALYRHLLDMGATDYLVRPLKMDDLINVIAKALLERLGSSDSQLVTVMGAKGGIGTSRIAQILTHGLAQLGGPTTLLDCGGSWGLCSTTYGREPMIGLRDLANLAHTQRDALDDLIHKVTPQVSWVATGGDPMLNSTLSSDGFEDITNALAQKHPMVIADLSQSSTGIRAMAFAKSHHIVLVTTATPLALRNARLLIKEIHQLRGTDTPLHLVVNENGLLPKEELSARDIQDALGLSPAVQMDFQPDLFARLDTADPQPAIELLASLAQQLTPLIQRIGGKTLPTSQNPPVGRNPSSLFQRLLKRG